MRIAILAIGQDRPGPETDLSEDYLQRLERLGRGCGVTGARTQSFAESKRKTATQRKAEEAGRLMAAIDDRAGTIALSERGRQFTSKGFAGWLRDELENATPELCFLIGGPDGHDRTLEDRVGLVLSLGEMTWPHRLVKVMLTEQIYRSVTILANHPYHRA